MCNLIGVYAIKNKNSIERKNSQSGGAFIEFAKYVLSLSGVVYGSYMEDTNHVKHIRVDSLEKIHILQGSKYVQSEIGNSYSMAKKDLQEGKIVLFSGTSCQIDGLKSYLHKEYLNLFTIDIICHGVPSPMVWSDYVQWVEKRRRRKIRKVDFREKTIFPWGWHIDKLIFDDNSVSYGETYTNLFYGHNILRPSCYNCPYKNLHHSSDITIGDYWGIDDVLPEFSDENGVSMVLVNSIQGKEYFDNVVQNYISIETGIPKNLQQPLYESCSKPDNREQFWREYYKESFQYIAKKYGGWNWMEPLKIFKKYQIYLIKKNIKNIRRKLLYENK